MRAERLPVSFLYSRQLGSKAAAPLFDARMGLAQLQYHHLDHGGAPAPSGGDTAILVLEVG